MMSIRHPISPAGPGRWRPVSFGRRLVVPLAVAWAGATAQGSATVMPFVVGETLDYRFYWTGVPVGQARAMVRQGSNAQTLRLILSAKTNTWIDKLYLVRLKWISTVNRVDVAPTRLIMAEQENHRRSQYVADFDRTKNRIVSTKKRLDEDRTKRYVFEDTTAHDALSMAYAIRARGLKPGQTFTIDAFTGRRVYRLKVKVRAKQRVTVKAGTFAALYIEAQPKRIKPPPKPGRKYPLLRAWISADQRHVPVKVTVSTRWAAVSGELVASDPSPTKQAIPERTNEPAHDGQ